MVIFLQFKNNRPKPPKLVSTLVELFWSNSTNPNPKCLPLLELLKAHYIPSESEKRFSPFLCFYTNFFLPWVCMWNLRLHAQDTQLILQRTFKVKWWSKFDEQAKLTDTLIRNWLSSKGFPRLDDVCRSQSPFL